jgi:hypothetical protein
MEPNEKVILRPKSAVVVKKVPKGTEINPPLPKLKPKTNQSTKKK